MVRTRFVGEAPLQPTGARKPTEERQARRVAQTEADEMIALLLIQS